MVLINRDDQSGLRADQDMDSARLEAHEEWAKTQRHGRPYINNIKGSLKKKVDDAQRGDFGPLFIAVGVTGLFLTLIVIIVCSRGGTKSET
mmetsp:Transcript_10938/g.21734  ORF Transcript_10938/g.21734 Transcript_10938/m.21734 type:complete len:91 (+) Transcript_10938:186-458(+)|eukprot:CAMPEP_0113426578 /NCGR_PEP_ID=MMETSP0013_2-20120614/30813_1 /TAXON_ID=2843 ORGANISM="Skeletonema costatum, Strain 1716" /NCGR_SAMPLE_ID=MMETSP0013_2 /ASSEMBLY_ACC=CAM_ASM_000158 /LENGTH=90 /DNA_ID=CAMNT_0000314887 /DNA_START=68 /DNA_END=340 /DNA_ORIENTATION=+ /assembly_acc=CAM_ASM_000158